METLRKVLRLSKSRPTVEGAGVLLRRAFGYGEVPLLDPFLLLDHFGSEDPRDYVAGFPWHPHRGIETVTYMIAGEVEHGDSMGNRGTIGSGDVQWMTAGSGIIHQEMPREWDDLMTGFQLWVNLPSSQKMMPPRYRDVRTDQIPEVRLKEGIRLRVICGEVEGAKGPVRDIVVESEYLDVTLDSGVEFEHRVQQGFRSFAYVFEGRGYFDRNRGSVVGPEHLIVFQDGDRVNVTSEAGSLRFLLISGKPIGEPVAWRGPIVMNTEEELDLAFEEYRKGTFIKHGDR